LCCGFALAASPTKFQHPKKMKMPPNSIRGWEPATSHSSDSDLSVGWIPPLMLPVTPPPSCLEIMRTNVATRCLWGLCLVLACGGSVAAEGVPHYAFFNRDRERIFDASFLETKAFEWAQLKYTWRELEPWPDAYDFSAVRHDLAFLNSKGKKLFIQLQDDEKHAVPEGWVARRWDSAVQERFHKLLLALGREFDGKIEGINLAETAVSFGESWRLFPKGFTPAIYRAAVPALSGTECWNELCT
jgi:hypothetical protein